MFWERFWSCYLVIVNWQVIHPEEGLVFQSLVVKMLGSFLFFLDYKVVTR
jgi:hypothetical protein